MSLTISIANTPAAEESLAAYKQFQELFPTALMTDFSRQGEWTEFKLTYTIDAPAFSCSAHENGYMAIALTVGGRPYLWAIATESMENRWPEFYIKAGVQP